jgi:hypothetical protein
MEIAAELERMQRRLETLRRKEQGAKLQRRSGARPSSVSEREHWTTTRIRELEGEIYELKQDMKRRGIGDW